MKLHKSIYLIDIYAAIEMESISTSLVIKWDYTATELSFPVSGLWRRKVQRVEIAAVDDNSHLYLYTVREISACTVKVLLQNVCQKMTGILLKSPTTGANETTTIAYLENIIIPYVQKQRTLLALNDDHCALVLIDVLKGQCTSKARRCWRITISGLKRLFKHPNIRDRINYSKLNKCLWIIEITWIIMSCVSSEVYC